VQRNGAVVAAVVPDTSYTDTGLTSGTSYIYAVAAVDSSKSVGALSSTVNATTSGNPPPPPPIAPPSGLAVTGVTNTSITIAWAAEASATAYNVYADGAATATAKVATNSCTQGGLQPQTSHT
jgi:hypothetical protein